MPQPNMQQMLRQVQKMQQQMAEAQEQLKHEEVEASAGGGMVKVKVSGDLVVKSVTIAPEAIDPDDPELLQDMVLAAIERGAALRPRAAAVAPRRPHRRHGPRLARVARLLGPAALYAPPIQRLITELGKLPGIGPRTAQRLAFHVLRSEAQDAHALADAIREVKEKIGLCEVCFNLADGPRCRICTDERRDAALICVVEEPGDVIPVERTHEYRGRYHVLGGALSPIDGVDPEDLKLEELYARVVTSDPPVSEVVLATNPTTTGEATALHIAAALRERSPEVAVTRLASGLPVGSDLEYADEVTLGKALVGRRAL